MYPFHPEPSESTLLQSARGNVAIINALEDVKFEKENEQEIPYPVRKLVSKVLHSLYSTYGSFRLPHWITRSAPGSVRARRRLRSW